MSKQWYRYRIRVEVDEEYSIQEGFVAGKDIADAISALGRDYGERYIDQVQIMPLYIEGESLSMADIEEGLKVEWQ